MGAWQKIDREDSRLELRYKKEFEIENDHFYEIHRFRYQKLTFLIETDDFDHEHNLTVTCCQVINIDKCKLAHRC